MDHACSGKKSTFSIFLQGFIVGILGLSVFYYLLLFAVTSDSNHPYNQFLLLQPWMSILIVGFGIQFGLFWLLRRGYYFSLQEKHDAKMAAGTGTAVSAVAMVACCAHHLVDLLPILGLSAAALFLSEYQEQLLIFGVVANGIGIATMLWFITGKVAPKVLLNFISTKIFFVILLVIAGVAIFGLSAKQKQEISATASPRIETSAQTSGLSPQTKTMGAVEVEVKPVSVTSGKEVIFEVSVNTHSVELNYDYTKIATLTDDRGNSYKPTKWTGGNSGHHLEGDLYFDALPQNPKELTLTLEGVDNKVEIFSWQL